MQDKIFQGLYTIFEGQTAEKVAYWDKFNDEYKNYEITPITTGKSELLNGGYIE